ncbi:MerR family transcriptional regulator [mine drainage metagenome]|jgi:Cd(II)/Pb(II)-responsive transcriptional regulator|uniref:Mercuric resistance operon regulatory protein n=3 Tax=root TaxID=1 RepID=A0A149VXQ6_9PROT|nr:Cd(II)/Pb(II)-responsive transcriptional regulator [Ferrovum myxofaciens]KXW58010.1 mercuric resistance operon regulatory protein [Ferrovum myxofaciens]
MKSAMRIGELGQSTGVDIETIRYYEKTGLLKNPERSSNGYRAYGPEHLERLSFIRHCRALDMPLADIKRLLEFVENPAADCGGIDQLISTQLSRVRARLKSMRALEQQLTALRNSCDTNHSASECGILHELVAAAQGETCACHRNAPSATTPDPPSDKRHKE